jgi:hypothetical protein
VISYFYAGIAKLNPDWLLDAQPVRRYLAQARIFDDHGLGLSPQHLEQLKQIFNSSQLAYFISYAGVVFDLSIGCLLLARRTRLLGLLLMLIFHGTNHFLIFNDIEWFPLLGLATALIFLDPDWPERFWDWLRRPRLIKPDWAWLVGGALAVPVVGASLGWKLQNREMQKPWTGVPAGTGVTLCFLGWLVWQGLMPLRQYVVHGDSRFTWEGLSFSWRLKAEVYSCTPLQLSIEDSKIISSDSHGRSLIDWRQWHGDRVIYRRIVPGQIDWSRFSEIFVLLEPMVGERVIYNPFARASNLRSETERRQRINELWRHRYGRAPQQVVRTQPLSEVFSACAKVLEARGYAMTNAENVMRWLNQLPANREDPPIDSALRQMAPLALQGEPDLAPQFLVIEDSALFSGRTVAEYHVNPARWVEGARAASEPLSEINLGHQPLEIYSGGSVFELKEYLPSAAIIDQAGQQPTINWNYLKELTLSEGMNVSMQPFLLRRYARHVANLWENEYGHRPIVHALTAVSLNGRPLQPVVEPHADLATVPVAHFRHNAWIEDLQIRRIPVGAPQWPGPG